MKSKLTFASFFMLFSLTAFAQIKRPDGGPPPIFGFDLYSILIGLIIGLIIGYFIGSRMNKK